MKQNPEHYEQDPPLNKTNIESRLPDNKEESNPDEEEQLEDCDNNNDSYGTSYEKYNSYNGWSDDVIDDAFDGDPEATWNVD